MGKKLLTFALCLFLGMSVTLAQNRIITGTVTGAEDGFPIPGAAVFVEGTNIGTVTDVDGKYSLNVHKGTLLKVTFFGMKDAIISIGTENVINVVLSIDAVGLDEVVVTATGMTRQEKTLGYASTTVRSDELTKGRSADVLSGLAGKVAGMQISSAGATGTSQKVIVRGYSSLASNAPLYVIDGVPISNGARPLKKTLELKARENRVLEHDSTFFTFRLNNRFSESCFYR